MGSFGKKMIKFIHLVVSVKGYSLYSRLVSSMLVWTPFPRGTCTPSKVTAALGSGAVLPKPEGIKSLGMKVWSRTRFYILLTQGIWVTKYSTIMPSYHLSYKIIIINIMRFNLSTQYKTKMPPVLWHSCEKCFSPLTLCLPLGNFVMWEAFFNSCLH